MLCIAAACLTHSTFVSKPDMYKLNILCLSLTCTMYTLRLCSHYHSNFDSIWIHLRGGLSLYSTWIGLHNSALNLFVAHTHDRGNALLLYTCTCARWTHTETQALLQVWEEENVQQKLKAVSTKKPIFDICKPKAGHLVFYLCVLLVSCVYTWLGDGG